jgi:glyoxylase-like metal-dependent hydrolase (beta-lactamase superfamily II)
LLTHAHPDHQGCAAKICRTFNVPLACHELDADSAEGKAPLVRQNALWELVGNIFWAGPRSPVGVAIVGDVINTNDYVTGMLSLVREPPRIFSVNPAQNRESIRRLAALKPSMICAGHGPPLRDMKRLARFLEKLPAA